MALGWPPDEQRAAPLDMPPSLPACLPACMLPTSTAPTNRTELPVGFFEKCAALK